MEGRSVELGVLAILRSRALSGQEPVTGHALAALLGVSLREVQAAVDVLIKEHHEPVASSTHRPFGYFLLQTEADRERYKAQLLSRMRELAHRTRCIATCRLFHDEADLVALMGEAV